MQKANVCIISKNKELSRFFELELVNLYCEVAVSAEVPVSGRYDAVIIDRDTVRENVRYSCPVLNVSETQVEDQNGFLPWPSPINAIRERLLQLIEIRSATAETHRIAVTDDVIYAMGERAFLLNGEAIELSKNEAKILAALCGANGETVSRESIMDLLGADDGNISDVYICHLRKKLEGRLGRRLIFTHRNKGYSTSLKIK